MKIIFWGKYIPLQGVPYIVRAAHLLRSRPDITFELIGDGQTRDEVDVLAGQLETQNISFISRLPVRELPGRILRADICLGIFGNTDKARRVIPNKAYEAIAMGKPLISGDTPAIRELFTDRENILLCKMADAHDLADKITELATNGALREKIASEAYLLYKKELTPVHVVAPLLERLSFL